MGKVSLPKHGGEGADSYKGSKSDMKLPQHGGEGDSLKSKGDHGLLKNTSEYRGPGANLGK